ncbi:hypothetical protein [Streptomyces abyssomicinicus]|uniref:hypothetical protein n=1 Tax=Streptomyces abyssomicinicus TaxID=574929 RepID=UPI00124FC025|nr:hypothetical protein [Streptomyces abyssomicinicus]
MGSRAHFLVHEAGRWERYYAHWGAEGLALDLLPGPRPALRFVRGQEQSNDWWHDPAWLEGCALIDVDRRVLSFDAPCGDPSYRAALLAVLAETWAGWHVEWAYFRLAGLVALAGRAGMDPGDARPEPVPVHEAGGRDRQDGPSTVLSMADGASVWIGGLVESPERVLCRGGSLLVRDPALLRPVEVWKGRPTHGLHLDLVRRTGGVWTSSSMCGITEDTFPDLPSWPGWKWQFWGDDAGRHAACLAESEPAAELVLPALDHLSGLRRLAADFAEHQQRDSATRSIGALLTVIEAIRGGVVEEGGKADVVVDNAMAHRPGDLTEAERAHACAAMDLVESRLRGNG